MPSAKAFDKLRQAAIAKDLAKTPEQSVKANKAFKTLKKKVNNIRFKVGK